ncbi:Uncharacterised protein [Streptococcus pneumoniae]|nr:Uncharacterised protein [Streptococcus pneumoniae]
MKRFYYIVRLLNRRNTLLTFVKYEEDVLHDNIASFSLTPFLRPHKQPTSSLVHALALFSFPIHALNRRTYYLLLNSQFPYDVSQYALSVLSLAPDSFARLSVLALIFRHNRQLRNVQLMINSLNAVLTDQFAVINAPLVSLHLHVFPLVYLLLKTSLHL